MTVRDSFSEKLYSLQNTPFLILHFEGAYGWVMKPVTFRKSLCLGDETCDISHPRVRRSARWPKTFQGAYGWVMKPVTFRRSLWLGDETCDISHPRVRRSAR